MKNKKELIRIVRSDEGEFSVERKPEEELIYVPMSNALKKQKNQKDLNALLNQLFRQRYMISSERSLKA